MTIELAGDHMTMVEADDGTATFTFDDKGTGRVCGDCQLCCRLLPVLSLSKPANVKCQHAKYGKGCTIYARRPHDCRTWSCRWLVDHETAGLARPDRSHLVIDMQYDTILKQPHDGGPGQTHPVLQVWADPAFRDAHRALDFRAYLARQAKRIGVAALIRYSSQDAFVLAALTLSGTGQWQELPGVMFAREQFEARTQGAR